MNKYKLNIQLISIEENNKIYNYEQPKFDFKQTLILLISIFRGQGFSLDNIIDELDHRCKCITNYNNINKCNKGE